MIALLTLSSVQDIDTFISVYNSKFGEEDSLSEVTDDCYHEEEVSDYQPRSMIQRVSFSLSVMT